MADHQGTETIIEEEEKLDRQAENGAQTDRRGEEEGEERRGR